MRASRCLLTALALVFGLPASGTTGAVHPVGSASDDVIAFARAPEDFLERWSEAEGAAYQLPPCRGTIHTIRADGKGGKTIGGGGCPAWSPDGKKIAFANPRGVFVWSAATGKSRRVAKVGFYPTWSPNGRRIAFATDDTLYVSDAAGKRRTRVAASDPGAGEVRHLEGQFSWSPDSQLLAVSKCLFVPEGDGSGGELNCAIEVVSPAGQKRGRLAGGFLKCRPGSDIPAAQANRSPAWSPDGRRIAFSASCSTSSASALYLLTLANGSKTRVVKREALVRGIQSDDWHRFQWSSDGAAIAYVHAGRAVRVVERTSRRVRTVLTFASDYEPDQPVAWSRDGRSLAVAAGSDDGLQVVDVSAAQGLVVTNSPRIEESPSWRRRQSG